MYRLQQKKIYIYIYDKIGLQRGTLRARIKRRKGKASFDTDGFVSWVKIAEKHDENWFSYA